MTIRRRRRSRGPSRKKEDKHRVNKRIRAKEVRLVGDNVEMDIYPIKKALAIAEDLGLDLVEISPKAKPPVVKAMDYKKFLFEQKKRDKARRAKASKVVNKEIRFGPNTDDHDYEFKKNHAKRFLQDGAKVKAYVFFRGRSIVFKDKGEILLLRLAQDLEEYGKVEQMPKLEGKRMTMFISPTKSKN